MNKKHRIAAVALAAALSAGALLLFGGCTTRHPEVTITYTFNGKDYAVEYTLSRDDAPQTVIHFIELADAGFYNGTVIHDYTSSFLYGGGYRLLDEDGNDFSYDADNSQKTFELTEINYFEEVKALENAPNSKIKFTQSVWYKDGTKNNPKKGEGVYTVRSESTARIQNEGGREYSHSKGALVMYASAKSEDFTEEIVVERADGGKNNNGQALEYQRYIYHSTTSLFYTYTSSSTSSELAAKNTVFGKAKKYDEQLENGLLKAIRDYISEHTSDEDGEDEETAYSFTEEQVKELNRYEPFPELATAGLDNSETPFATPMSAPIIIKSVKVTKY